jgi:RNA polymerase primary sigma factor
MRQLHITQSITSRESASLERYLQEISKVKLLTMEEEVNLCALIKEGNQQAIQQLAKANLRFVVSVAKKYQHQGLSLADLINEGNIGLMNCVKRFDSTRGFKFISYAVWWIRQSIIMALAENSRIVRLPLNRVSINGRIRQARSVLEQNLEREPSAEELAEVLNMELKEVTYNMGDTTRHVSLDSPLSNDEGTTLLDTLESDGTDTVNTSLFYAESLKLDLIRSMKYLTSRQKEVICCFFGIGGARAPLSLDEIGKKFNLTAERIRQIKDKALVKLRATECTGMLRSYL